MRKLATMPPKAKIAVCIKTSNGVYSGEYVEATVELVDNGVYYTGNMNRQAPQPVVVID